MSVPQVGTPVRVKWSSTTTYPGIIWATKGSISTADLDALELSLPQVSDNEHAHVMIFMNQTGSIYPNLVEGDGFAEFRVV